LIAYFYVKKEDTEETSECGLKLSKWFDTDIVIDIFKKKAITAYLSPKDNMKKYKDKAYDCLKLDLHDEKIYIVENAYKEVNEIEWYFESIIPAKQYKVGMYRKPVFVITYTVLGDYISILDKSRDIPILYDSSEEMYLKTLFTTFEENDDKFYDRAFLGYVENIPNCKKINVNSKKYVIYIARNKRYIIKGKRKDEK